MNRRKPSLPRGQESVSGAGRSFVLVFLLGMSGLTVLVACVAFGAMVQADDVETARRQRIERMTPAEKERLRRRLDSFSRLNPQEQRRLRELHEKLHDDPQSQQLQKIMHRYCRWLKQLPPYRRAELQELEPAERIERIKQLLEEEANRLTPEDVASVFRWLEQVIATHETEMLESLPEQFRQKFDRLDPPDRRRWLTWMTWQRWLMGRPGPPGPAGDEDLKNLRSGLSERARKRLEAEPAERQWEMVADWIRQAFHRRMVARHEPERAPPGLEEELNRFFENELSVEQRDQLLSLPSEDMHRELRRLYLSRFRGNDSRFRRPRGPGRGMDRGPGLPDGPFGQRGPRGGTPPEASPPHGSPEGFPSPPGAKPGQPPHRDDR